MDVPKGNVTRQFMGLTSEKKGTMKKNGDQKGTENLILIPEGLGDQSEIRGAFPQGGGWEAKNIKLLRIFLRRNKWNKKVANWLISIRLLD